MKIKHLLSGINIEPIQKELSNHTELWDKINLRTKTKVVNYFEGTSDIWVRANDYKKYDPQNPAKFLEDHHSVWYPSIKSLPKLKELIFEVMNYVQGEELGGILITKVPVGSEIKPHTDSGWHQSYYDKFAVQIHGNAQQAFCFENESLSPLSGDLYWFNNTTTHWVTNESTEDRITLIMAIKPNKERLQCLLQS